MNQPKKHHYVPRFLLKNFSFGKKDKEKIHIFDKASQRSFVSSIKDAGAENYFYRDVDERELSTEDKLSKLETETAPIIEKIINEQSIKNLTLLDFGVLSLFIAVQKLRTNNQRHLIHQMNQSVSAWFRKDGIDPNKDVENFMEISKEEADEYATKLLHSIPGELAPLIIQKAWVLHKAPKHHNFLISDHPVTLHNHRPRPHRGNLGVGLEGIEIQFPISSSLCLTLFCPIMFGEMVDKLKQHRARLALGNAFPIDMTEIENMVNDITERNIRMMNPENMEFNNSLQVQQSSRFIYAIKNDFNIAQEMTTEFPDLRKPPSISSNHNAEGL